MRTPDNKTPTISFIVGPQPIALQLAFATGDVKGSPKPTIVLGNTAPSDILNPH